MKTQNLKFESAWHFRPSLSCLQKSGGFTRNALPEHEGTYRVKPFPKKKANASWEHSLVPVGPKVGPFGNIVQHVAAPSHPAVVLLDKGVLENPNTRTPDTSGEEISFYVCFCLGGNRIANEFYTRQT